MDLPSETRRTAARNNPGSRDGGGGDRDTDAAKPTDPPPPATGLSSVARHDVWSECLKFLPPPDMATASTGIGALLSSSTSDEQMERASWLALESAIGKADRMASATAAASPPSAAGGRAFAVRRYPGETWTELYALFCSLVGAAEESWAAHDLRSGGGDGNANDNPEENEDGNDRQEEEENEDEDETIPDKEEERTEIMNGRSNNAWMTACWLLFGWPEGERLPLPSLSSCEPLGHATYAALLGSLLHEKASQEPRNGARMLQSALRLSDAGDWSTASSLLALLLADDPNDESGRRSAEESSTPRRRGHRQEARELELHDAEIGICICTFLIDRLYSSTYVQRNANDSEDMSRAVHFGREAIRICSAQSQQEQQEPMVSISSTDAVGNGDDDHAGGNNGNQDRKNPHCHQQQQPPPPASLFQSDSLRLAGACLATGKALALLAQHIGLGATRVEEIDVRPIEGENGDGYSARRTADERFFQEGEAILKSSISRLEEEEEEGRPDDGAARPAELALFEVKAATVAALGELYYCSASVDTTQGIEQSISFLAKSLRMVQQRLVGMIAAGATRHVGSLQPGPPTVESLCSTAPRSLMLLQARTAKDLGKVYRYSPTSFRKEKNVLEFALAVCTRLQYEDHPSVSNIRRLYRFGGEPGSEDDVNQWLSQDPLFKDL